MVLEPIHCPSCHSIDVVKHGQMATGAQRYRCRNTSCARATFMGHYQNRGYLPEVKASVIEMALNGSGIRDTARVLKISPSTVINELKKKESSLSSVNEKILAELSQPETIEVVIRRCEEAELDEMWSFVGNKRQQRWLWHAVDHDSGQVLAYAFGTRQDEVFLALQTLLEPFGIQRFYSDGWGAYQRPINEQEHCVGKRNTQIIERKHLTLRTRIKRLARKTICFSKVEKMHDIVIGLFINRYEFGNPV